LGIDVNEDYVKNALSRVIVGATQSGATRMDPSLNGDEPKRDRWVRRDG
jgi:hypothetical protein